MISKLEKAIQDLDAQKQDLLKTLQEACWMDDRLLEKIPETRSNWSDDIKFLDEHVTPEQAPLPHNTHRNYQHWVSAVRVIIAKNQPERLAEFNELYEDVKRNLIGRYIDKHTQFNVQDQINRQFDLLSAIPNYLKYSIYDIELEAYSILMDDELKAAQHLLTKGFFRSAGVLAGVLLERHLKNILRKHTPTVTFRKNATLSKLNDTCKDTVYDSPTWRKVQHLSDLRNICAHDKVSEPTKTQVDELILGVSSILKMHTA